MQAEQMKEAIDALVELQRQVGEIEKKECSDTEFARRFLPYSSTVLSRLRSGSYAGNLDRVGVQSIEAAEDIRGRLTAIREQAEADRTFVRTKLAAATLVSINRARDMTGRRVVVLLAPTGAGKSCIGGYLASKGAIYVEGRQSWQHSYRAFCADVADAAGRPIKHRSYGEREAESAMLGGLGKRDGTLYIDEANTLGPSTANAIKLIVNQTGRVVVVASIPEMWDRFVAGSEDEVRQVVNRCQPILRWTGLPESDAAAFLKHSGLASDAIERATALATAAANEFGAFKLVTSLVEELRKIDRPGIEDVQRYLGCAAKDVAQAGISPANRRAIAVGRGRQ